ncbi:MAG: MmcQ/YjbR family DNA-binding protein [Pseudomonadota bacterium]
MTRDEFNAFCGAMTATSHVVQWGGADVWKVGANPGGQTGGKVFAVCGWNEGEAAFTFKTTPFAFEVLSDMPGLRPAPYLASRGMKWIQQYAAPGLSDTELKDHIEISYRLVALGFSKKKRLELGLGRLAVEDTRR